jgi:hypothetical protein
MLTRGWQMERRANGDDERLLGGPSPLRPDPEVVGRCMGDDLVLIHLRTNLVYTLNRTAARAWELLTEGCDRAQVRARLLEEFDVDETRLDDEIERLLSTLVAHKLVRENGGD